MRYTEGIQLSEKLTKAIADNSIEFPYTFINELSNAKKIKQILESYDYLNESKGQVSEFEILPESLSLQRNGEGSFKVTYFMEFFYACDAITTKHAQEMTITFKVNTNTGQAMFSGEDVPEREPDEL